MDTTDRRLLRALAADGRATWTELAATLELSPPSIAERVRKLEERGAIRGYSARVDPDAAGAPLLAFIFLRFSPGYACGDLVAWARAHPQVMEAHHVAGDFDHLLKVRSASVAELERLVVDEIRGRLHCERTNTVIALSTSKETPAVPIADPDAESEA